MQLVNLTKRDESDATFVGGSACVVKSATSVYSFNGVCFSSGWSIGLHGSGSELQTFVGWFQNFPIKAAKYT